VAAELGQHITLCLSLDALGRHGEAHLFCEREGARDEAATGTVAVHIGDERAVDLDLVYREVSEPGQRAQTGAEVVHREPYPESSEIVTDNVAGGFVYQPAVSVISRPVGCRPGRGVPAQQRRTAAAGATKTDRG